MATTASVSVSVRSGPGPSAGGVTGSSVVTSAVYQGMSAIWRFPW